MEEFRRRVFEFYEEHGRDLPWRDTHEPYKILVSEVMLQQTQVSRVVPKYEEWIERWPTNQALAETALDDIMPVWQGLGYNNRAKRLRNAAAQVEAEHEGDYPRDIERLQELPGVGPYTASALLIFAFNEDVAAVDTNIRRVLIHEFDLDEDVGMDTLYSIAHRLVPTGRSREWHNALMDYGALEATSAETGVASRGSQSPFEGSTRYYRGKVVRRVTEEGPVDVDALDIEDTEEVLESLQEDGLIVVEDGRVSLAE